MRCVCYQTTAATRFLWGAVLKGRRLGRNPVAGEIRDTFSVARDRAAFTRAVEHPVRRWLELGEVRNEKSNVIRHVSAGPRVLGIVSHRAGTEAQDEAVAISENGKVPIEGHHLRNALSGRPWTKG